MFRHVGLRAGEAVWRSQGRAATSKKSLEIFSRSVVGLWTHPFDIRQRLGPTRQLCSHSILWRRTLDGGQSAFTRALALKDSSTTSSLRHLTSTAWRRHAHTRSKRRRNSLEVRHKSSISNGSKAERLSKGSAPKAELSPTPNPSKPTPNHTIPPTPSILDRLPHLPSLHRPTKEELLAAATGAWSRFKIHFKWFSIRSFRPWNIDDISAFFTWIIAGHLIWILLGTTTFFSLLILLINTVFAQETLAKWIGNYLTQASGLQVVFESAVVPGWKDGVISFQNVFVSRRPGQGKGQVKKGSQSEAKAAAAQPVPLPSESSEPEDDGNYTQFDVSIDAVNVTLSFAKWFNGKGLLRDVEIKGIRGVVDRTHVISSVWADIDPRTWKHEHQTGDFELDSFKMEDLFITIHQPGGFRPFPVSIHLCELPRLRKQWLFYDFISANVMSGAFDNAMFAIHPRQEYNFTGATRHNTPSEDMNHWKKHARFRIDGLNIDHLNRGVEGMFAWIKEGKVDIVSDMMFPSDDEGIAKVMSDFYDRVEATVTSSARQSPIGVSVPEGSADIADVSVEEVHSQAGAFASSGIEAPKPTNELLGNEDARFLVMDIRVQLNEVRATVPLFTRDISYINNALIRPIVAYINSRRAFIPVNCRVVKRIGDFDGSWTIYDSGLMEDLNKEIYEAFARDVLDDDQLRRRRFKKVGVWTLQLAAQALFIGLAGNIA